MRRLLLAFILLASLASPGFAQRRGGSHSTDGAHVHRSTHPSSHSTKSHHGKIHRSAAARHQFIRQSGYPHGRKGYVVDHKIALACGGADDPSNMQWQTKAEAKAKDKAERKGC